MTKLQREEEKLPAKENKEPEKADEDLAKLGKDLAKLDKGREKAERQYSRRIERLDHLMILLDVEEQGFRDALRLLIRMEDGKDVPVIENVANARMGAAADALMGDAAGVSGMGDVTGALGMGEDIWRAGSKHRAWELRYGFRDN